MMKCNSISPPDFNIPARCIFILVNIGSSLVSILGNALVMVVLHTTPKLKTRWNYFLLLLAGINVAISSIAQPITCLLVMDLLDVSHVCIISDLLGYIYFALWGASMGMLALISYDSVSTSFKVKQLRQIHDKEKIENFNSNNIFLFKSIWIFYFCWRCCSKLIIT